MEKDLFIEQILETENLTDELEDEDAQWLNNWGIGKLSEILQGVTDFDVAGMKVNRLMAVMRKINQIAGRHTQKKFKILAGDLKGLQDLFEETFGRSTETKFVNHAKDAANLDKLSTRQILETLTGLDNESSNSI